MKPHAINLLLLAPNPTEGRSHFTSVQTNLAAHTAIIKQIRAFRQQLYCYDGAPMNEETPREQHYCELNTNAWHLISRGDHGEIQGCIRIAIGDLRQIQNPTESFLTMTGIEFCDPVTEVEHVRVIEQYFAVRHRTSPQFFYVGGL